MMIPQTGPPAAAHAFLEFVNASPTPFHAVHVAARRLEKSGFRKVILVAVLVCVIWYSWFPTS
jgi:aspartyl aminopeptidase